MIVAVPIIPGPNGEVRGAVLVDITKKGDCVSKVIPLFGVESAVVIGVGGRLPRLSIVIGELLGRFDGAAGMQEKQHDVPRRGTFNFYPGRANSEVRHTIQVQVRKECQRRTKGITHRQVELCTQIAFINRNFLSGNHGRHGIEEEDVNFSGGGVRIPTARPNREIVHAISIDVGKGGERRAELAPKLNRERESAVFV